MINCIKFYENLKIKKLKNNIIINEKHKEMKEFLISNKITIPKCQLVYIKSDMMIYVH